MPTGCLGSWPRHRGQPLRRDPVRQLPFPTYSAPETALPSAPPGGHSPLSPTLPAAARCRSVAPALWTDAAPACGARPPAGWVGRSGPLAARRVTGCKCSKCTTSITSTTFPTFPTSTSGFAGLTPSAADHGFGCPAPRKGPWTLAVAGAPAPAIARRGRARPPCEGRGAARFRGAARESRPRAPAAQRPPASCPLWKSVAPTVTARPRE